MLLKCLFELGHVEAVFWSRIFVIWKNITFFCMWFEKVAGKYLIFLWFWDIVLWRFVSIDGIIFAFKYVKQRNFNLYKFQHCEGLQLCWRQLVAEGWQVTRLSLLDMDGEILRRDFHCLIGMEKFWWQLKGRRFVLQM